MAALDFSYQQYSTFSGADIVCTVTVPILTNDIHNGASSYVSKAVTIGNLQTVSISTHRDKFPVRAFGSINPKGFTRGIRTIAGSLIFTMFDRDALREVREQVQAYYKAASKTYAAGYNNSYLPTLVPFLKPDELPPFDVTITGINDNGQAFAAKLYGIEIVDSGQVMGIDDLLVEETMSYLARDFQPPTPLFNPGGIAYNGGLGPALISGPDKGNAGGPPAGLS